MDESRFLFQKKRPMPKVMINVYELPAIAWVVLRLGDLGDSYRRIFCSVVSYDDCVLFCGAIRHSLFAYAGYSERDPGEFVDTVEAMLAMADQVLEKAASARDTAADKARWDQIINSIDEHRKDLAAALAKSIADREKKDEHFAAAQPAADASALLAAAI